MLMSTWGDSYERRKRRAERREAFDLAACFGFWAVIATVLAINGVRAIEAGEGPIAFLGLVAGSVLEAAARLAGVL
jgi:hypothetical protein